MEETLKTVKDQKLAWERKIKDAEQRVKDQGKMLAKIEDDEEYQIKQKSLVDELRMWKEKIKRSEEQ